MILLTRYDVGLLAEKLDLNLMPLRVAKAHAARLGFKSTARTKGAFLRDLFAAVTRRELGTLD